LGYFYLTESYAQKDIAKGERYFRSAIEQGDSTAMFQLGSIYWNGYYIPKNTEEALKLWRQSAELGNGGALSALGTCYLRGEGLEQNYDEAFECFVEADDKDMLGTCYLHGWGVKRDVNKTIELWSDFAESYNSHGLYEALWHLLIDGIEMEPDYERGFYWLNYAAYADEGDPEGGDYNARYELARCYYEGKGTRKDVKRALKLFRSTIELFYRYDGSASVSAEPDRIINARRILVKHGYKSEINKLKKAAENGDAKAAEILREFEIDFDIPKPTPMVTVDVKETPVAPAKPMREPPINIAVGDKVLHKTFGEGCVCESNDGYICVEFDIGKKKFLNPEAFNKGFLKF
jgi:TPR repeat protein